MHFYLIVALIVATALMGGSSRPDAASLLLLRPIVVLLLGGLLLIGGAWDRLVVRAPAVMLALFAATMALQLVPLPLDLWLALPGHRQLAMSVALAGPAAGWRPISLYPDLTLNALVALLPGLAVVLGYARLTVDQRQRLLPWLVTAAAVSALLGFIQIVGGGDSPAYLYHITSPGLPVGLFANRNHQAVFLALMMAALAVWGLRGTGRVSPPLRIALTLVGILLFLPVIVMTGSRTGLITAFATLLALPWVLRVNLRRQFSSTRSQAVTYAAVGLVALVVAVMGYMVSTDQAMSINRLLDTHELSAETRILAAPVTTRMLVDFFPVGLGHGAFEPLFRAYEPDAILSPDYFNRAHNDIVELAMSGGVPTIIIMLLFVGWFGHRVVTLIRRGERGQPAIRARMAAVVVLGLALASITDYPIRTPFLSVVFALAAMWIEDDARYRPDGRATG